MFIYTNTLYALETENKALRKILKFFFKSRNKLIFLTWVSMGKEFRLTTVSLITTRAWERINYVKRGSTVYKTFLRRLES